MNRLLLLVLLGCPIAANSAMIYVFEGECSAGCTGIATGTLTLADTFSDTPTSADFLSFSFSSSNGSYTIPGDGDFLEIYGPSTGAFPVAVGAADVFLDWTGTRSYFVTALDPFDSFLSGFVDATWASRLVDGAIIETGLSYTWTRVDDVAAVPIPGALWLFATALLGLGGFFRRRKSI